MKFIWDQLKHQSIFSSKNASGVPLYTYIPSCSISSTAPIHSCTMWGSSIVKNWDKKVTKWDKGGVDTNPDISFPTLNPAYMGLKPKHSFPAYSLASWLQNPLSSMETDTAKDKHLDYLLPQRDTGWWESCWPARSRAPFSLQVSQGQREAGGKAPTSKAICSPSPT